MKIFRTVIASGLRAGCVAKQTRRMHGDEFASSPRRTGKAVPRNDSAFLIRVIILVFSCFLFSIDAQSQGKDTSNKSASANTMTTRPQQKALIVLDGVPFDGVIGSINPNNISDVTILKAQGAIALYGDRGKNGAILITTKANNKFSYEAHLGTFSESYFEYLAANRNNDKDFDYVVNGKSLGKDSQERTMALNQLMSRIKKVDITINPSYNGQNTQATVTITTKQ